jgi:2-amino-4-deoxychorismate synthase
VVSAPLDRLLTPSPPPFALLYRPGVRGRDVVDLFTGDVMTADRLADIPLSATPPRAGSGPEMLAFIPYRQVREREFECRDDGEPIIAMRIAEHASVPLATVLARLPDTGLSMASSGFDLTDEDYAAIVSRVITDEIGRGEGSNFVVRRTFTGHIRDWSPAAALTLFRHLLASELGSYWTFVVCTGDRTFVGATPERHISLSEGVAAMSPISGTYRYPPSGPTLSGVLDFLVDRKETEELHMVVDEELKMMAGVCDAGAQVRGPFLREMARLAHTEYSLEGPSSLDVRELIGATMFAPTVTGSPIENACRVLSRHEPTGRGFYSGIAALAGWDGAGRRELDSAILIRTADIDAHGRLRLGVGATLVRHSNPAAEVQETRAKAATMLAAAGISGTRSGVRGENRPQSGREDRPSAVVGRFGHQQIVRSTLARRNAPLAPFWFEPPATRSRPHPGLEGMEILVVDAEDAFTAMLGHQLSAVGPRVRTRPWDAVGAEPEMTGSVDVVILGPGPGDPADLTDPRIATMRSLTERLFDSAAPFVSVCLSHQVLAGVLGLPLMRKVFPSQGLQREIDLFEVSRVVGFYNTFAAVAPGDRLADPRGGTNISVSRDQATGEVHALRGAGFASVQFHPESVLTREGPAILADLLSWVTADQRAAAAA